MAELDEIINRCLILDCKMIVVVPSENITVHATRAEIRTDAVAVLKEMVKKRLSLMASNYPLSSAAARV
ncbi:hypothetical protein GCM10020331_091320 [Ectobacillus funiculus]